MKPNSKLSLALAIFLAAVCTAADAPDQEVIKQYRAYVAAVRAGNVEEIKKLVVPVSEPVKPVQLAHINMNIALERLRKEAATQFGPIDPLKEDEWVGVGELTDDQTQDVRVKIRVRKDKFAQLSIKSPDAGEHDVPIAILLWRNGKWLMPIGLDLNQEDITMQVPMVEPADADEREYMLHHFEHLTKAAEAILNRLQKKEFKKLSQVSKALAAAIPRADGEIDK